MQLNRKGFIGSIGDDIPSLIPLLFALILFFGTFSYALNVFITTNSSMDERLEVMRVSRLFRANSLISSRADFEVLCSKIPPTNMSYMIGIVDFSELGDAQVFSLDEKTTFFTLPGDSSSEYVCFSDKSAESNYQKKIDMKKDFVSGRMYSMTYPVAVSFEDIVLPMHLIVVGWKP